MAKQKLLIVEDDDGLASQYRWAFAGWEVLVAQAREPALALARKERPAIAILDLGLPPDADGTSEGFAALDELQRLAPEMKTVIATGSGDRAHALKAIAAGAYDFCEKPVDIEVLRTIVARALRLHELEQENRRLAARPAVDRHPQFHHRERYDAARLPDRRTAGSDPCDGAVARRERDRQGSAGARGCTNSALARQRPSSPSIARRSPRTCSRASSSATSGVPSPGR